MKKAICKFLCQSQCCLPLPVVRVTADAVDATVSMEAYSDAADGN